MVERRRGGHRREDAAGGHGQPRQAAGPGHGAAGACRIGGDCAPKLNKEETAEAWFAKSNNGEFSPKPKLANEKPQGVTVDYDKLLQAWVDGKVMPEGIKG